jgi:uncharacterized phage-like protein YoqJ
MKIAGTGHRPEKLGGYADEAYERVFLVGQQYLVQTKPELIISGMALGWDTALAEAAFFLGTPFHAYIPFEGQERKWPAKAQRLYRNLLKHAAKVVNCGGEGYAGWKMHNRNECMVNELGPDDRLVALWNGDREGGTYNCIQYAEKQGVQWVNLWGQFNGQPVPR